MRTRSRLLFHIKRGLAWFGTILVVLVGGRPLAVLWASRSATAQDYFRTRREETAAFSTNSVTRVIQGADHGSILGNEQFARQVSAAILDVMQSTKTGQPLAR